MPVTTIQVVASFWDTLEVVHDGKSYSCYKIGIDGEYMTLYKCEGSSGGGVTDMHPFARFKAPEWTILENATYEQQMAPRKGEIFHFQGDASSKIFDMRGEVPWELKRR